MPPHIATLFDFNGVLVDDEAVHLAAFRDVVAPLGITLSDATYAERYLGFDDRGAFEAMLRDAGHEPTEAEIARLVAAKVPLYMDRARRELVIYPGAAELVARRASQAPVGIVSGALRHEIEFALDRMGITSAVSFVVSAEDTKACKPDPEGYLLARAKLGADVPAVVIEDSIAGVQSARRAGLRCVAVMHTYGADELLGAGAEVAIEKIAYATDRILDGMDED